MINIVIFSIKLSCFVIILHHKFHIFCYTFLYIAIPGSFQYSSPTLHPTLANYQLYTDLSSIEGEGMHHLTSTCLFCQIFFPLLLHSCLEGLFETKVYSLTQTCTSPRDVEVYAQLIHHQCIMPMPWN